MQDPPIEGEVIDDRIIDPQARDDAELSNYLDEVVTRGFPLSLLERVFSLLKGLGYGAAAVACAFISYLFFEAGIGLADGMFIIGAIALLFDLAGWLFTLYLLLLGLANISAAFIGRMPLRMREANEQFEA